MAERVTNPKHLLKCLDDGTETFFKEATGIGMIKEEVKAALPLFHEVVRRAAKRTPVGEDVNVASAFDIIEVENRRTRLKARGEEASGKKAKFSPITSTSWTPRGLGNRRSIGTVAMKGCEALAAETKMMDKVGRQIRRYPLPRRDGVLDAGSSFRGPGSGPSRPCRELEIINFEDSGTDMGGTGTLGAEAHGNPMAHLAVTCP